MPINATAVYRGWIIAKATGMRRAEYAAQIGISPKSLDNLLYSQKDARLRGIHIPVSRFRLWTDNERIKGDALILGDLHIPYHDAPFIERCIKLAVEHDIHRVILGGDALECESLSSFTDDFSAGEKVISAELESEILDNLAGAGADIQAKIRELLANATRQTDDIPTEVKEARQVLKAIDGAFDEIIYIMGNHEARILHALEKALSPADLPTMFGIAGMKWKLSPYYWCELESAGKLWRITHPKNSSKGSSKRLSPKYDANIIMLHGHHFSVQTAPNGRFLAVEPGACADIRRLPYEVQRDTPADMHITGACLVMDGKIKLINDFTI